MGPRSHSPDHTPVMDFTIAAQEGTIVTASPINNPGNAPSLEHKHAPGPAETKRHAFAWLRQPLIHFLIAGFALFVIYGGVRGPSTSNDARRIEITPDDVHRIEISWLARWQRPPTASELRGMIDDQLKEEILYREALALGLDKNDEIIRRRLAQKMDFLADDVGTLREPAPGELEAWYGKNAERFAPPPLVTFRHVYFASDMRPSAEADARKQLATLATGDGAGGDAFMFQSDYAEQTPDQVARVFGSKFASSLFQEKAGAWRGPLESGFGWHLVWIDSLTPSQPPAFETVAAQARTEWLSEERSAAKRATLEALKARYEIFITQPAPQSVAQDPKATANTQ
jgi:peptidyl-prolyl cis-trans isomerase C